MLAETPSSRDFDAGRVTAASLSQELRTTALPRAARPGRIPVAKYRVSQQLTLPRQV
jgi:hypothetical protein